MFKVNAKNIYNFLVVCSILAYAININLASLIILLLIALYTIEVAKSLTIKMDWADCMWTLYVAIVPAVLNLLRTHEFHTYLIIGYFLAVIVFIKYRIESIEELLNILKVVSIIEATSVYVQFFLPSIYKTLIKTLMPEAYNEIIFRQSSGYYTGLTKEVSFTVWFIIIGMSCYFSECYFQKRKCRFIWILIYLTIALLMTGKKAQPLIVLISMLVIYIIISNKRLRIVKLLLGALLLIGIIYITFPMWEKLSFMQRYVSLINNIIQKSNMHVITTGRIEIYKAAIDLWKQNKIFGIGWGNFRFDVEKSAWYSWFDVHNCYLQLLCETGVIGLVVYILMITIVLYNSLASLIRIRNLEIKNQKTIVAISTILFFFLGYSITGTCLYEYSYYIIFFLCIKKCNNIYKTVRSIS